MYNTQVISPKPQLMHGDGDNSQKNCGEWGGDGEQDGGDGEGMGHAGTDGDGDRPCGVGWGWG